ncbi:MAG: class I SAM-dependent methyltransferase [Chloroflexota bacterium]|nr:class I SAM-dependent methyltransferase [Chloroflexota bacterium]MQG04444.1 class I SAM-dependent methyltransferase [SAR202 cluster bacterium]|tara:strand:- start:2779 stop:3534 length:756 start_codon:yes stop_codon:yes gene_type:complete
MDPKEQFDRQAKYYANSPTFSLGLSLELLSKLIKGKKFSKGLDIGTGSGFTAFEISKNCSNVDAIDISTGMLNEAKRIKKERGIKNVNFKIGYAEELDYEDESFDLITCRTSAHHFKDIKKALNEISRVIKNDGSIYIIDTITSDQKELNNWHQKIELIRDKSHIKNYSLMEWRNFFEDSGLDLHETHQTRVNMELEDWMERSGTISSDKKIIRNEYGEANNKIKEFFGIEKINDDFKFYWPVGLFYLKKY